MIRRLINIPKRNSFFLFGARGTGKSTLLRTLFDTDEALWIDLLDPGTEQKFFLSPETLKEMCRAQKPKWVVVDEVQKLPKLLDVAHDLIENDNILFALTGSSARKLKRGQANLLAGRAFTFNLFPFCSSEIGLQFDLNKALHFGTLPKVWNFAFEQDIILFLISYTQTYVKEEVSAEQLIRNIEPFRKFLPVAARSVGRPLNYTKIGRDSGIDPKSVERYFSILEDTLLGFFLESYHLSVRKKQRMASKFYFFDVGVQRALAEMLDVSVNEKTSYYGDMFEAFVLSEIFRMNHYLGLGFQLSYLQVGDSQEIDLIIEKAGKVIFLVEIKSSQKVDEEDLKPLQKISKDFPGAKSVVLSRENFARETEQGTLVLPWRLGIDTITFQLKS